MAQSSNHVSRLKTQRLKKGYTQKQLATLFNSYIDKNHLKIKHTSFTTISRWESGVIEPKDRVLNILAAVLDTRPDRIRGYELTLKEKEKELKDLLGRLYSPYMHDEKDLKVLYDNEFYDDFADLLDTSANDYVKWRDFDVTRSLDDYLTLFYPDKAKLLDATTSKLFDKFEDFDQFQKAVVSILPQYLNLFISKLTKDVDKEFPINHDHWFNSDTISFLVKWFNEQVNQERNRRHPEYKKMKNFYTHNIVFPLMDLQTMFDSEGHPLKENLTEYDIQKKIASIKSSLDQYGSMLIKML